MPNSSRNNTIGRFARKLTWRAYADGPFSPIAVEFEIRMCSNRNAPTGMMPVRECSRRNTKEMPWPARNGATPCLSAGAEELADATEAPYKFVDEQRTFHYLVCGEVKSRNRG